MSGSRNALQRRAAAAIWPLLLALLPASLVPSQAALILLVHHHDDHAGHAHVFADGTGRDAPGSRGAVDALRHPLRRHAEDHDADVRIRVKGAGILLPMGSRPAPPPPAPLPLAAPAAIATLPAPDCRGARRVDAARCHGPPRDPRTRSAVQLL